MIEAAIVFIIVLVFFGWRGMFQLAAMAFVMATIFLWIYTILQHTGQL
jgi:hypothetical protein